MVVCACDYSSFLPELEAVRRYSLDLNLNLLMMAELKNSQFLAHLFNDAFSGHKLEFPIKIDPRSCWKQAYRYCSQTFKEQILTLD
jgi:hypothetical protein